MKNNIAKLDHVNFTVSNFKQSADWYKKVFNFELVERGINEQGRQWGILKSGDTMLAITEFKNISRSEGITHHQMNHFGFRLIDEKEWEQVLKENALETFYSSPVRYPNSTSWYIKDPTGNDIEVSVWKNNEVWFPEIEGE